MTDALLATVRRAVGIYGTAPTCYLSALARVDGFTTADLDAAVQARSLVAVRAMRYSVHLFPRDLLPAAVGATRKAALKPNAYRKRLAATYDSLAAKVDAALAAGPLTASEIRAQVDPGKALGGDFTVLLGMLGAESRIVRAGRTGSWRSDRLQYARWSDWLPDVDPAALGEEEARHALARHYVAAYGPVGLDDLRWWAGWTKTEARAAAVGLDLAAEGEAARALPGVRLLPVWDVLMVAYLDRARLVDPEWLPSVYDKMGNATSVVLDAGRVVGVWDLGRSDDPLDVKVAPFGAWPKRRWAAVEAEVGRIATLVGADKTSITRVETPPDLQAAPRNRFLSPLSG